MLLHAKAPVLFVEDAEVVLHRTTDVLQKGDSAVQAGALRSDMYALKPQAAEISYFLKRGI